MGGPREVELGRGVGVVGAEAGPRTAERRGVRGGSLPPASIFQKHRVTIFRVFTFYNVLEFLI